MDDERSVLVAALESILDAQNIKVTRIMRSTRILDRFGDAGKKIVDLIQQSNLGIEQSLELVELSRKYDSLREEVIEVGKELVDAEDNLAKVYTDAIKTVWKETHD